jgi:hypothetical protein
MKRLSISIICAFLLVGCSILGTTRNINGNSVMNIEDPEDFSSVAYVDYFDYQFLVEEEKEKAGLIFEEPNLTRIPEFGYIIAHFKTPSIGSANPKYWQVIIKDKSGKIVKKVRGRDDVANYNTTNGVTVWKNMILVTLPEIEPPFEVYIVSDISKKRWGYRVLAK